MNQKEITELLSKIEIPEVQIELAVGMPRSTLYKAKKGDRDIAKKFIEPLKAFVQKTLEESIDKNAVEEIAKIAKSSDVKKIEKVVGESYQFDKLLSSFNELVASKPSPESVKQKIFEIREMALSSAELNCNQFAAMVARCDNYMAGNYGKSYSK